MFKIPRISDTEWEIMRVVWARHPIKADEIIEELQREDRSWHPVTAKTLINRLVRKGALGYRPEGRAYLYRPLVDERDCVNAQSQSFLQRVFGGSLKTMVEHLVGQRKVSSSQLRELRRVLDHAR
jgi:BlaI family penicillinase repressor